MDIRNYGKVGDLVEVPSLTEIQTKCYADFLQVDVTVAKRKNQGLEAILREIFPIDNYDGTMKLEYIKYELGRPRYSPDECRELRLTYGYPFRVWLRLTRKDEPVEELVYLGDVPKMMGGGEFIINGAERVIVTQLHRSPGVDFIEESDPSERRLHACRIIPERGSWIELNVSKKEVLTMRIDQSGKMPATCPLRAMAEDCSTNAQILRTFYSTKKVPLKGPKSVEQLVGSWAVEDILNKETGEVIVESACQIPSDKVQAIADANIKEIEVVESPDDLLILNTIAEDPTTSHEEALLKIYTRLRPGNPPSIDKAKQLFHERFFDVNRYRLGKVGRFRLNRRFGLDMKDASMTLQKEDLINCISYLLKLRRGEGTVDDIDHLGNRRLRTIDELAGEEFRKGFLKLRRTVTERMNLKEPEQLTPRTLVNSKTISSSIDYFFGRSELSQVVDQTNPLAQLTHERRLSALGPGGLNRKRAGFDVRDVHISHYGRICPIETPEGTNIGLIASLSVYAGVDEYGFLTTPYAKLSKGKASGDIAHMRADEEDGKRLAPSDFKRTSEKSGHVLARLNGDFNVMTLNDLDYSDVSPKQLVGVSASLIPFLEHSDANRALMGSNMQRQAVPLLSTEPPLVATGMEKIVAQNSGMVVRARNSGTVESVTAEEIKIDSQVYRLRKFVGLNERTCLNQKPIIKVGEKVRAGQVIADGAATCQGELSLGRNVLVAFMPYEGYNFEDAIVISERLVKDGRYTSIHIEEFETEARETKLGKEEFTRDIPNVSERALKNLDEDGIIRIGTKVGPADILVGKIAPKSKSELTPEEKLLHAIFGRAGEDVKNDSLEVPSGVEGIVIGAQKFSRRTSMSDEERHDFQEELERECRDFDHKIAQEFTKMLRALEKVIGGKLVDKSTRHEMSVDPNASDEELLRIEEEFDIENVRLGRDVDVEKVQKTYQRYDERIEALKDEKDRKINQHRKGDELPSGVLEMVKVYVATKRTLSVGDKMAGRHGNKGVIAKIVPEEDMPFLGDGTPVEILLNPLGVPSRMNVGQILETHLGWAASALGFKAITPIFDGATEKEIEETLKEASLPADGKTALYDGRTGEPFDQTVTVGYIYMMKLHHLVDDKVHARATGPYSLITQQPLGGKARFGGQRFGEMEVWALEAYGAAHILQELLTVKSDDVEGRTKIYEAMVKGENTLEAGTPVSFDVLRKEIAGLALKMELEKKSI
ncbi:MAG: DNA-directed RNA polymerase subunit beta [Planctomycetota bacterium]